MAVRRGGRYRWSPARLNDAGDFAAESGNTSPASSILSFKAYTAGRRGDAAASEGLTAAARRVPDVHPALRVYSTFQHARAHAVLRDMDEGARLLDEAAAMLDRITSLDDLPPWGYWYSPAFFTLQIGATQARLGAMDVATDLIMSRLSELPDEQRGAQWTHDFLAALDEPPAA